MPQNLRGRRPRRFGHNLLIRGGVVTKCAIVKSSLPMYVCSYATCVCIGSIGGL